MQRDGLRVDSFTLPRLIRQDLDPSGQPLSEQTSEQIQVTSAVIPLVAGHRVFRGCFHFRVSGSLTGTESVLQKARLMH